MTFTRKTRRPNFAQISTERAFFTINMKNPNTLAQQKRTSSATVALLQENKIAHLLIYLHNNTTIQTNGNLINGNHLDNI